MAESGEAPDLDALARGLLTELGRRPTGLGHLQTCRYFAAPFARLPGGITYATALKLEAAFDMVRLIYANDQAAPFEVTAACIASPATPGAAGVPIDAEGQPAGWMRVTFGSPGEGDPPGQRKSRLLVPGATVPGEPVFAPSDWMALPSRPPAEGDGRPWLTTRSFFSHDARCVLVGPDDMVAFDDPLQNLGRRFEAFHQSGDFASTPEPMERAHPYGFVAPVAVQYRTRAAGLTITCVGDSITAGAGTRSHYSGWGLRTSAALSRPDLPVSYVNAGWSGAPTRIFHAAARNFLPLLPSGIVVIAPFSVNDRHDEGDTARLAAAGLASGLTLAREVAMAGLLPALLTPLPWSGMGETVDTARRDVNTRLRTLGAQGVPVVDIDAMLSDHAAPARLREGYHADGLHPRESGNDVMAGALGQALLRRWPLLRRPAVRP